MRHDVITINYGDATIRILASKLGARGELCKTVRDWSFCIDLPNGRKISEGGNVSLKMAKRRAVEIADAEIAAQSFDFAVALGPCGK